MEVPILAVLLEMEMEEVGTVTLTVTVAFLLEPSIAAAVIFTEPAPCAVTLPLLSTVAILGLLLLQAM